MSSDTRYALSIPEQPDLAFEVVSFKGYEALGRPFQFTFELHHASADLKVRELLRKTASFELQVLGKQRQIHGMIASLRLLHPAEGGFLYQLQLVPRLSRLGLIQTNEVYLEQTLPETLTELLEEGEFTGDDFDLDALGEYRSWEYRCQFGESHLDFLHRITEREGVYYRFQHKDNKDQLVFHDNRFQHLADPVTELRYQPETGRVTASDDNLLHQWISQGEPLPRSITLKDYNSNSPLAQIQGEASIDPQGFGSIYRYCDNLIDTDEAERLAGIRAEELLMRSEIFHGESRDLALQTGLAFSVSGHYRASDNGDFYPCLLEHEGFNPAFRRLQGKDAATAPYRNRFQALRSDRQFRPVLATEKPRFHGVLHAIIDAGDDGRYANIDPLGRYKVILPFDRERTPGEGKASCWIPMLQPSAGTGGGMHFPLLKDTEVLLSFIGGDPDRPVISGALPNTAYPSVINDASKTRGLLRSASGNRIEMEDQEGSSRLKLYSPTNNTYLHLGAPNHSGSGFTLTTDGLYRSEVIGGQQTLMFAKEHIIVDDDVEQGVDHYQVDKHDGEDGDTFDEQKLFSFPKFKKTEGGQYEGTELTRAEELSGEYLITRQAGHQYNWADGDVYNFGGNGREFSYGGGDESLQFFVEPDDDRYEKMAWDLPEKPKGAANWGFEDDIEGDDTAWSPENHYVEKGWGNTFSYQMGNNYSWGDTADYDFGNGYEEAHIDESIAGGINQKIGNDKANQGGPYLSSINGTEIKYSDPGKVAIAKTYGNSYEYTKGKTLEVQDGDSESHQHGDSWDYKHGDSFEETYGLSKSIQHGRTEEFFMGGTVEMKFGAGKAINLNAESEITLGLNSEIFIGAQSEISLAASNEISIGSAFEMSISNKAELSLGSCLEVDLVTKVNTAGTKLESIGNKIEAKLTEIKAAGNRVDASGNNISSTGARIASGLITLIS